MGVSPHSPRRQRQALYTAHRFERRRRMTVLLSRELRKRFHRRSVPVHKGDTVRVLGGSYKGREERVARIDRRAYTVTLDNVTLKAADEKMKPLGLRPGRLVITRLNLADSIRRRSLRIRDEDVTPEERGEPPTEEAPAEVSETMPSEAPSAEPEEEPAEDREEETSGTPAESTREPPAESTTEPSESTTPAPPRGGKRSRPAPKEEEDE